MNKAESSCFAHLMTGAPHRALCQMISFTELKHFYNEQQRSLGFKAIPGPTNIARSLVGTGGVVYPNPLVTFLM